MRYLLGALAAAGISLTGLIKGRSLTLKCETLNQIIRFLKEFRSRIEYSEEPVSVIIEKFCAGGIRLSLADKCLRYMQELDRQYPQYQLAKHKGYPTRLHYELLAQYGIQPFYRRSFLKKQGYWPEKEP